MKKNNIALGIIATLVAGPTLADNSDVWLGGFAEYYYADKDKFNSLPEDRIDPGFGFELGERFSESWAFRIEYARIDLESYPNNTPIDGYRFGLDAMYFPWENNTYVFAGLKHESLDTKYGLANIGVGQHWELNNKWTLITEVAAYHDFGQGHKDYSAKIGLAYRFGKSSSTTLAKTETKPEAITQTAVAPVTVPLDSDLDGVIDTLDKCPQTPRNVEVDSRGCELVKDSDNDGVIDSEDKCPNTPITDKTDAQGCTLFTTTQDSIDLAVLFEQNSSLVQDNEKLKKFADFMKKYPDVNAEIEGHSSAPGEAQYNLWLSQKRAEAVKDHLVNRYGIDEARLTAIGYGETRLLDPSNTPSAHKVNRRIEAKISVVTTEKVTK